LKSKLESALGVKVRILTRCSKFEEIKSKVVGKRIPVNFSAGPAILPRSVIDQLSAGMVDFAGDGLSIGEISHRSKQVQALVKETEVLVRELLKVPDNYVIFFIQGGATLQFGLIPMNFATKDDLVGYVEMGQWSKLCIEDAYLCEKMGYGKVQLLGTGKPDSYRSIPKFDIPQNLKYIYLCHNETVHGLEFEEIPDSGKVPYILDVSSDIFAKPIDFVNRNIGMVFAGAQKNTGFAGCAIVVIRKDFLNEKVVLPSYFNYAVQASTGSFVNTPPVVTIFSINLMMKWVKEKGGVDKLFELNKEKANLLYDYIDSTNGYYVNRVPIKSQRSIMNVVFNMGNRSMEDTLQKAAIKAGIYGLDGHRSIGGCRASIYNAMDIVGVKKLIEFLKKFRKENP
jgi:phosphoserine aminotransferase